YTSALEILEKIQSNFSQDAEIQFLYAQMLKQNGFYERSTDAFDSFLNAFTETKEPVLYEKARQERDGAILAKKLKKNDNLKVVHIQAPVNQPHIDFSPVVWSDSLLLYASLRASDATFTAGEEPKRRFYLVQQLDTGVYREMDFSLPFNDLTTDCVNGTLSPDGKLFVFAKCTRENPSAPAHCQLFSSSLQQGKWSNPRPLSGAVNDSVYTSTYPALAEDSRGNTVLYFCTNREGSIGGMDIWYSVYDAKKKTFKAPKNCGKKINTVGNEIAPYYSSSSKQFFFSSDVWPGLGGFDVFQSAGELKKWSEPRNMGAPVNSSSDDLQYVLKSDLESGYFVSNRLGGVALENQTCCDDIYEFYTVKPIVINVNGQLNVEKDSLFVPADSLAVIDILLSADSALIFIKSLQVSDSGKFTFTLEPDNKYRIIATQPGFLRNSIDISTYGINKSTDINAFPVLRKITDKPVVVKNIYYPFDKDYLTEGSQKTIDTTIFQLLIDNPEIVVEIGSHTDALGKDDYNLNLSQRRAQSVVDYLISKGIKKDRLIAKGYGETQPIAPNANADGSDNPDGRQRNRRTEFKIVGTLPGVNNIYYEE
ncbi:MAG TPA: OmpA family protein, partial [Luteibaculaceae bacterium]|nr:OmpA family protein [Luteibaculaceae bacterium]